MSTTTDGQAVTLASVIAGYLTHQEAKQAGGLIMASTMRHKRRVCAALKAAMGREPVSAVGKLRAELYTARRLAEGVAPITVNSELDVLRSVLSYAVDDRKLDAVPRLRTLPVRVKDDDAPDPAVVAAWLDTLPEEHALPLRFSALTGLSWHEVQRLHVGDVKLGKEPVVQIGARLSFTTKTLHRQRDVPLSPAAVKVFKRARELATGDTLFPRAARTRQFLNENRTAHGEARFGRLTPKDMRRVFASTVARGAPEAVLQKLLGHAPGSRVTRRHYVRVAREDMTSAARAVGAALR